LAQVPPQVQEPAPELRPACAPPQYSPVPPPDTIAQLLQGRKRYRLVIGAGEFLDQPALNNRTFVEPTAVLVDARLAELGYEPLPGVVSSKGAPYLVGKNANRTAISAALDEMANAAQGQDFGIVYYVGHGNITPAGNDLTLSLYEEPVSADHGYRVTDLFGRLETGSVYRSSIKEIPHLFIVLDACFSGTIAQASHPDVATIGGVQRLVEISGGGPVIPDQMSLLTSTAPGSTSSAYELQGTGLSAFGYYFARALKEDWACSDAMSKDGILTLLEMKEYLRKRLLLAFSKGALVASMSPRMLARDENSLLAYRADKYNEPGFRELIYSILVEPSANQSVDMTLPGGATSSCSDSVNGCSVLISKEYLNSNLTVTVPNKGSVHIDGQGPPPPPPQESTVRIGDLLNGSKTVLGVNFRVNQITRGPNSPAITGVGGDVNININAPASQRPPSASGRVLPQASGVNPNSISQDTSGANSPAVTDVQGSVNYSARAMAPDSVQQHTVGSCSPAVADTQGNVTITCYGVGDEAIAKLNRVPELLEQLISSSVDRAQLMSKLEDILGLAGPAPTDAFPIYAVVESDSRYRLNLTSFEYKDIEKYSSYQLFRKLLAQIPNSIAPDQDVVIFRLRDESVLEPTAAASATSGGNLGVLIIPKTVVANFGSSHLAFAYFKSAIDQR
jgi:hypothetical protein